VYIDEQPRNNINSDKRDEVLLRSNLCCESNVGNGRGGLFGGSAELWQASGEI
jgi:hypothetical protein